MFPASSSSLLKYYMAKGACGKGKIYLAMCYEVPFAMRGLENSLLDTLTRVQSFLDET